MRLARSIVLVDDDIDDQEIFRTACASIDRTINVVSYENGEMALKELSDMVSLPDLIFLDLNMPRINGMEVLEALKGNKDLKAVPVVVYTTSFDAKVKVRCEDLGAVQIMEKPNNYDTLCQKLRVLLKGRT